MERRGSVERANVESKPFGALSKRCVGAAADVMVVDCPEVVKALVSGTVETVGDQKQCPVDVDATLTAWQTVRRASDGHDRPGTEKHRHRHQLDGVLTVAAARLSREVERGRGAVDRQHTRREPQLVVVDAVCSTGHQAFRQLCTHNK